MNSHRWLDQEEEDTAGVDLSKVSLRFEQCQFIRTYDDTVAAENPNTVMATKQFAIFKLCPTNDNNNDTTMTTMSSTETTGASFPTVAPQGTSRAEVVPTPLIPASVPTVASSQATTADCTNNYGEYVIPLKDYLQITYEYQSEVQDQKCADCFDQCPGEWWDNRWSHNYENGEENADDNNFVYFENPEAVTEAPPRSGSSNSNDKNTNSATMDCFDCYSECSMIENTEANGYIDATEFLQCQMIYDPEDDDEPALYAGPLCASMGEKIKIAVFTDDECQTLDDTKNVEDYLLGVDEFSSNPYETINLKLSYLTLKKLWPNTSDDDDEVFTKCYSVDERGADFDMCQQLYSKAAKCETPHGFPYGMVTSPDAAKNNNNQLGQEDTVCDFLQTLKSGTYHESGEIYIDGVYFYPGVPYGWSKPLTEKGVTVGQWIGMGVAVLAILGLIGYAIRLRSKSLVSIVCLQ